MHGFWRGEPLSFPAELDAAPVDAVWFALDDHATNDAVARREAWLLAPAWSQAPGATRSTQD